MSEGTICEESGWELTSVVYKDRMPDHRVFYVQHDCTHKGQHLSYKSKFGEGWEQELQKLSYIVCNRCGKCCPKMIFDKFVFLRAMNE